MNNLLDAAKAARAFIASAHSVEMNPTVLKLCDQLDTAIEDASKRSEATITVQLANGMLTVKHGDTGETLLGRPVSKDFWENALWPCLDGHDIKIRNGDAIYLHFENPDGSSAAINLSAFADDRSPITRAALKQWCERRGHEASARCPCSKCDQKTECPHCSATVSVSGHVEGTVECEMCGEHFQIETHSNLSRADVTRT